MNRGGDPLPQGRRVQILVLIGGNLGYDEKFFPAVPQDAADDGFALAVGAGRVNEVNAEVESRVQQLRRFRLVRRRRRPVLGNPIRHADLDRTERNLRYFKSSPSQLPVSHSGYVIDCASQIWRRSSFSSVAWRAHRLPASDSQEAGA